MRIASLDQLLGEGLERKVYGAADAVIMRGGRTWFFRAGIHGPTAGHALRLFDLASVTKVMSTTAMVCSFATNRQLSLDHEISRFLPDSPLKNVTIADLLMHRSGLPAFVPYFEEALKREPRLLESESHEALREEARRLVGQAVRSTVSSAPVGAATVYSDVGFLLLGQILEVVGAAPLNVLFGELIAKKLSLQTAGFRKISDPISALWTDLVPTQNQRPREPAPGQENMWTVPSVADVRGGVDDDNAWVMNGVAGHAGLFASALEVGLFGQAILEGRVHLPVPWERDAKTPGSTRTYGFDTPSETGASCGTRIGRRPPGAIGHLGYTGTSLWVDFARDLVVVLLSNRTHFGRANVEIREFRQRFHEAVIDSMND